MYKITEELFNNGVNDGDVIVLCKNDKTFLAHSFVLKYCSQHFSNYYIDICKSTSSFENPVKWDLTIFEYENVRKIVSIMYSDIEAHSGEYWSESYEFYKIVEYIMINNCLKEKIQTIFEIDIGIINQKAEDWKEILFALGDDDIYYLKRLRHALYEIEYIQIKKIFFDHIKIKLLDGKTEESNLEGMTEYLLKEIMEFLMDRLEIL